MERNKPIEITDDLLVAYLLNEANPAVRIAVEQWITESEEHQNYFNELSKTWEFTNDQVNDFVVDTNAAWEKVRPKLQLPENKVIELKPRTTTRRMWFAVAAALAVIVGSVTLMTYVFNETEKVTLTAQSDLELVRLTDGSEVELTKGAKLTYPTEFGKKERHVVLEGNAFFEIARDVEKPFVIELPHQLHVRVLGTSFTIHADADEEFTEVIVKTGKVEFGSQNKQVILTVGDIGRMEHATGKITKIFGTEMREKERLEARKKLSFDNLELTRVVEILNELFDDSVKLDCPNLSKELIVSTHENEALPKILTVIAEVHGLKVITSDNKPKYTLRCDED